MRGLASGAASKDKVASPTFTISKVYKTASFDIQHFDFYRLSEPGIVADELAEFVGDSKSVVVVEWGDIVQYVLPYKRLTITIKQTPDGAREFTLAAPAELQYLVEAVQ